VIKPKLASAIITGFIVVAVLLALAATFWEQDLISSMIGISSGFTMYYVHRNPELLMAKSADELYDL